jgi:hypothetical protein
MKQHVTLMSLATLLLLGISGSLKAGNNETSWPTPFPIWEEIFSDNFQKWTSTRTYSSDPLQCNMNNRATNFNWQNIRIKLPAGNTPFYANLYLHNCEVQPFCDTQSGTFYAIDTAVYPNAARDHLGLTNPGVSVGNITVLDGTTIGDSVYDQGWIVVGQMLHLDLIQYTISNFGNKRGFRLEYSTDQGQNWILIRNERGNSVSDTLNSTSLESLENSPKGTVWEDQISLDNAMLRFTRANANPQLFRLHDLRIYGIGLFEDMNDAAFEANSGQVWPDWMGVSKTTVQPLSWTSHQGIINFSDIPSWSRVINLHGQTVLRFENQQVLNLTELPKGMYMLQVCGRNGRVTTGKILR